MPLDTVTVAGLVAAPLLVTLITGESIAQTVSTDLPVMALAGLLVGAGTVLGSSRSSRPVRCLRAADAT